MAPLRAASVPPPPLGMRRSGSLDLVTRHLGRMREVLGASALPVLLLPISPLGP